MAADAARQGRRCVGSGVQGDLCLRRWWFRASHRDLQPGHRGSRPQPLCRWIRPPLPSLFTFFPRSIPSLPFLICFPRPFLLFSIGSDLICCWSRRRQRILRMRTGTSPPGWRAQRPRFRGTRPTRPGGTTSCWWRTWTAWTQHGTGVHAAQRPTDARVRALVRSRDSTCTHRPLFRLKWTTVGESGVFSYWCASWSPPLSG
jgi:hypothetical protein